MGVIGLQKVKRSRVLTALFLISLFLLVALAFPTPLQAHAAVTQSKFNTAITSVKNKVIKHGSAATIPDCFWTKKGFPKSKYIALILRNAASGGLRYFNLNYNEYGYNVTRRSGEHRIYLFYRHAKSKEATLLNRIKQRTALVISEANSQTSTIQKYNVIFKYLTKFSYGLNSPGLGRDQYSCIMKETGVCDDISYVFTMLASQCGLKTKVWNGTGHGWNLVKYGDKWFIIDATQGRVDTFYHGVFMVSKSGWAHRNESCVDGLSNPLCPSLCSTYDGKTTQDWMLELEGIGPS